MFFVAVFGTAILAAAASLVYLLTRFHKFEVVKSISRGNGILSWVIASLPVLAMAAAAYFYIATMVIVILHLTVIWMLAELAAYVIRKFSKKTWKRYWQGLAAIAAAFLYLVGGWYTARHVVRTDYEVTSDKVVDMKHLRVAMVADSHLGTTFDGDGFAGHMERIQEAEPDIVVVAGDFVDDDSVKADMITACSALGKLETTYGVYYVYGNHDRGYFDYSDYTTKELVAELEKNNVTILEDECVSIGEDVLLIGRHDKSVKERAGMDELMDGVDVGKYTILIDHQPNDYDAEADSGVDLVLSGHTHGGWLFPMGLINRFTGPDDLVYGMEKRKKTTFIVTSGISDWALPFKTGTVSEFVVVDIDFQ